MWWAAVVSRGLIIHRRSTLPPCTHSGDRARYNADAISGVLASRPPSPPSTRDKHWRPRFRVGGRWSRGTIPPYTPRPAKLPVIIKQSETTALLNISERAKATGRLSGEHGGVGCCLCRKTHVRTSYAILWPFDVKGRHQKFDITADATSSSSAMIVMAALPASLIWRLRRHRRHAF
jgi:hypothetical protein